MEVSGFSDVPVGRQLSLLEKKVIKLLGDYDAKYGITYSSKEDIAMIKDFQKRKVTALEAFDASVKNQMLDVAKCSQKILSELAPSNLKGDWKAYFSLLQTVYKAPQHKPKN